LEEQGSDAKLTPVRNKTRWVFMESEEKREIAFFVLRNTPYKGKDFFLPGPK
jgi:hypothetical protein